MTVTAQATEDITEEEAAERAYLALPEVRVAGPAGDTTQAVLDGWGDRTFRANLDPGGGTNVALVSRRDEAPRHFHQRGTDRASVQTGIQNWTNFQYWWIHPEVVVPVELTLEEKFAALPQYRYSGEVYAGVRDTGLSVTLVRPRTGEAGRWSGGTPHPRTTAALNAAGINGFWFTRVSRGEVERVETPEPASVVEPAPEKPMTKKELRAALATAQEAHRTDIGIIATHLHREAVSRDWCDDYDRVVRDMNQSLTIPVAARPVMVNRRFSVTVALPINRLEVRIPEDASDEVRDAAVLQWVQSNYGGSATVTNVVPG